MRLWYTSDSSRNMLNKVHATPNASLGQFKTPAGFVGPIKPETGQRVDAEGNPY